MLISSVTDRELWDYVADVKDSGGVNMCKMLDDYREDVKRKAEEKISLLEKEKETIKKEKETIKKEKETIKKEKETLKEEAVKKLVKLGLQDSDIIDALDLTSEQLEQYKKKIKV